MARASNDPPPRLTITNARPGDLPALVAIEQVSFPTPWSRASLAEEMKRPWSIFRILRGPEGEVRAYLNYWVVYDELHVLNIATHPDHRRRGYARILLEEMLRLAHQNAAREVHLEVRPSNQAARRLYERLGFTQVGVRPGYYPDTGEDALLYGFTVSRDSEDGNGDEDETEA